MKDERYEFEIKIDGETYPIIDKVMTASAVLSLASKSYDAFHLVEMKGGGHKPEEFLNAADEVKLHNGIEFITKHVGPTTVS